MRLVAAIATSRRCQPCNECWIKTGRAVSTTRLPAVSRTSGRGRRGVLRCHPLAVSLSVHRRAAAGACRSSAASSDCAPQDWPGRLTGRRWRWLLARFVPVLILGGGGLLIVALLVADMARVAHSVELPWPGPHFSDLTEIGSEGIPSRRAG